ncbi:hypothetical protein PsYK624_092880 [Phanerochaete sordida]|uniref:Uncharacterized protein n=1 Tax=Phanerochaete sordida TaxID=48140 RepID=A0A9P3LFZ1_9APHY|nr:hypothetical protein PsYK624_092880 [Phanerochaete sordida]
MTSPSSASTTHVPWSAGDFYTRPSEAGKTLLELHANVTDTGQREQFLRTFATCFREHPSQDVCQGLLEGRLPHALLQVMQDEQLYEQFLSDENVGLYVLSVYGAMHRAMVYAAPPDGLDHYDDAIAAWENHAAEQLTQLWTLLARYPHIFRCGDKLRTKVHEPAVYYAYRLARAFRELIADLMLRYLELCPRTEKGTPRLLESDLGHLAFVCWVGSITGADHPSHGYPSIIMTLFSCASVAERRKFTHDALDSGSIITDTLLARCGEVLASNSDWLVDDDLNEVMQIIQWLIYDRNIGTSFKDAGSFEICRGALIASQRQICSGTEEDLVENLCSTYMLAV